MDPDFRLQVNVKPGGRDGTLNATHLRDLASTQTIDLSGYWRCSPSPPEKPPDAEVAALSLASVDARGEARRETKSVSAPVPTRKQAARGRTAKTMLVSNSSSRVQRPHGGNGRQCASHQTGANTKCSRPP
jgi:hypothetical protein